MYGVNLILYAKDLHFLRQLRVNMVILESLRWIDYLFLYVLILIFQSKSNLIRTQLSSLQSKKGPFIANTL